MMQPYYKDDQAVIYHGDCLDILPGLNLADLVLTDPPYGISYASSGGPRVKDHNIKRRTAVRGDEALNPEWFAAAYRSLAQDSGAYFSISLNAWPKLAPLLEDAGFRLKTPVVWDKGNWGMGDLTGDYGNRVELVAFGVKGRHLLRGRRDSNLVSVQRPADAFRFHPTEKPIRLLTFLIEKSTDLGAVVLDPFMGSGSTLKAAKGCGRKAIGIEVEEHYCEVAVKRLMEGNE